MVYGTDEEQGILGTSYGPYTVRLVTHREITDQHVEQTVAVIAHLTKTLATKNSQS
jgi:threonine aldolase